MAIYGHLAIYGYCHIFFAKNSFFWLSECWMTSYLKTIGICTIFQWIGHLAIYGHCIISAIFGFKTNSRLLTSSFLFIFAPNFSQNHCCMGGIAPHALRYAFWVKYDQDKNIGGPAGNHPGSPSRSVGGKTTQYEFIYWNDGSKEYC